MQLSKEVYARKRIHNGCLVQIENPVTQDNSANLAMLNSYRRDRIFNPQLIAIRISYNIIKKMCNVRTFVTHEYEIFFVHTYVTYENVIWPAEPLLLTKILYLSVSALFLHMKMCNVIFSFTFFRIWTDVYQNVPKAERVRFTYF